MVASTLVWGEWRKKRILWAFHAENGGILNWWPSNGTVQFQGSEPGRTELQRAFHKVRARTENNCSPGQSTGGSTHTHVATDNSFSEPPHGQDRAVTFKASLAPLLRDLANVFANQGLVLMMVDGVPRIVKEYEYDHSVELAAETKPPMHISHY